MKRLRDKTRQLLETKVRDIKWQELEIKTDGN